MNKNEKKKKFDEIIVLSTIKNKRDKSIFKFGQI